MVYPPSGRSTEWPINRVADQPSDRSTEWSIHRVADQPSGRSTEWPINRVTDQPSGRSIDRSIHRVADQQSGLSTEWPINRVADQRSGRSTEWPINRVVYPPRGQSTEWPRNRVASQPSGLATEWPRNRVADQPSGRSTEWSIHRVVYPPSGLPAEWSTRRVARRCLTSVLLADRVGVQLVERAVVPVSLAVARQPERVDLLPQMHRHRFAGRQADLRAVALHVLRPEQRRVLEQKDPLELRERRLLRELHLHLRVRDLHAVVTCTPQPSPTIIISEHSTNMCTAVFTETVSYFVDRGSNVYACLLDASKAFDRVHYGKLFSLPLNRKMPAFFIRLIIDSYLRQATCTKWKGCISTNFSVKNGVKQGGVLSLLLFTVY